MVKVINTYDNYSLIERNNATRKGLYYQAKYKDINGKEHILERKANTISINQFQDNLNKVKSLNTFKEKRALSNSYYNPLTTRKAKKQREEVKEKVKTEKDYRFEQELSRNKLLMDRVAKKTSKVYDNEEAVIIMRVGSRGDLGSMSESDFERKLRNYMGIQGEPKGAKAIFLQDIVNKWGVEFKQ